MFKWRTLINIHLLLQLKITLHLKYIADIFVVLKGSQKGLFRDIRASE